MVLEAASSGARRKRLKGRDDYLNINYTNIVIKVAKRQQGHLAFGVCLINGRFVHTVCHHVFSDSIRVLNIDWCCTRWALECETP